MSQATADPRLVAPRAAPRRRIRLSWTDPVFRAVVWQIVIVGIVAAIAWYLIRNTSANLAARHIATGFGFLIACRRHTHRRLCCSLTIQRPIRSAPLC